MDKRGQILIIVLGIIALALIIGGISIYYLNRAETPTSNTAGKCGDNFCSNFEKQKNICPKDCGTATINESENGEAETCLELGGYKCTSGQGCDHDWLDASDTSLCCNQQCKNITIPVANYTLISNVTYKIVNGQSLQMDLYIPNPPPQKSSGYPVVVEIHGGGFVLGDKFPANWGRSLTGNGYIVAGVNYRLAKDGEDIFPAAVEDIKAAVRFLRAHADEYNIDVNNFGATGGSAGGTFASFLGVSGDTSEFDVGDNLEFSSSVKAVVDQFGPSNFSSINSDRTAIGLNPKGDVLSYTGCPGNCENAVKASPITYVNSGDAAFLIMHGTVDETVPITQSEDFYNALKNAGIDVTYIRVQGAGHGDKAVNSPDADKFSMYHEDVVQFFNSHLG